LKITNIIIEQHFKSLNNLQDAILQVKRRKRGWKKRLLGKIISDEDFNMAISMKGKSSKYIRKEKTVENKEETYTTIDTFVKFEKINSKRIIEFINNFSDILFSNKSGLRNSIKNYNKHYHNNSCAKASFVYLLKNKDSFKIGKANDVERRVKSIQTGSSSKVECIYKILVRRPFQVETLLHNLFFDNKIYGEWFVFSDSQLNKVKSVYKRLDESLFITKRVGVKC